MKRQCAWCKENLGQSAPLDDKGITHTICLACGEKMLAESRQACERDSQLQDNESADTTPACLYGEIA
jgi:hypothetical protein